MMYLNFQATKSFCTCSISHHHHIISILTSPNTPSLTATEHGHTDSTLSFPHLSWFPSQPPCAGTADDILATHLVILETFIARILVLNLLSMLSILLFSFHYVLTSSHVPRPCALASLPPFALSCQIHSSTSLTHLPFLVPLWFTFHHLIPLPCRQLPIYDFAAFVLLQCPDYSSMLPFHI